MARIPATGQITATALQTEYGGVAPWPINEYYRGGAYVLDEPTTASIPVAGTIKFSDFRNTENLPYAMHFVTGYSGLITIDRLDTDRNPLRTGFFIDQIGGTRYKMFIKTAQSAGEAGLTGGIHIDPILLTTPNRLEWKAEFVPASDGAATYTDSGRNTHTINSGFSGVHVDAAGVRKTNGVLGTWYKYNPGVGTQLAAPSLGFLSFRSKADFRFRVTLRDTLTGQEINVDYLVHVGAAAAVTPINTWQVTVVTDPPTGPTHGPVTHSTPGSIKQLSSSRSPWVLSGATYVGKPAVSHGALGLRNDYTSVSAYGPPPTGAFTGLTTLSINGVSVSVSSSYNSFSKQWIMTTSGNALGSGTFTIVLP